MPRHNNIPMNKPQLTWSIEDESRMNYIIGEFINSGKFEINFKDIWSQFADGEDIAYRRFVQKMCKKLVQDHHPKVKLVISRHWTGEEENLLRDILVKEIEMEKETCEIKWDVVLSKFKEKGGLRDKKALQERYRNYMHPKVYMPGDRKRYIFSKEQTRAIIDYKANNSKIGWKEISEKLNEVIDMQNMLNKMTDKKNKLNEVIDMQNMLNKMTDKKNKLNEVIDNKANVKRIMPHCTPNQVKNKYNTLMNRTEEPWDALLVAIEIEKPKKIIETEKIDKMIEETEEMIEETEKMIEETEKMIEETEETEEMIEETEEMIEETEKMIEETEETEEMIEETETEKIDKMNIGFITK
ncbi:hypothetical protein Glove_303g90 [Diversispora epigaea]|uniref:Myb-like domain-containing protein n=1 Tax=Diversispora epigaea TaxID=1348612 RepID=A0A397HUX5_9GLOM|nr:hypothetical protein Glove_303g90 [Diversispora epigaea]